MGVLFRSPVALAIRASNFSSSAVASLLSATTVDTVVSLSNKRVRLNTSPNETNGSPSLLTDGGKSGLLPVPLVNWNDEKQIDAVGKVRDVRHPVGSVMT